jgi:hypothetical protein
MDAMVKARSCLSNATWITGGQLLPYRSQYKRLGLKTTAEAFNDSVCPRIFKIDLSLLVTETATVFAFRAASLSAMRLISRNTTSCSC